MFRTTAILALFCISCPGLASDYCLPSKGKDRIDKNGTCPTGYFSAGNCCEAFHADTKRAIAKRGATCPAGFYSSARYCVPFR